MEPPVRSPRAAAGSIAHMPHIVDHERLPDAAAATLGEIAARLRSWQGPIVLLGHVDPDGDALGSVLTVARALRRLGKTVVAPLTPPRFLEFLARPSELSEPLEALPPGALLVVLDGEPARAVGAPIEGAAFLINLDHHPSNAGGADLSLVLPELAATAVLVKHLVDTLGLAWDEELATPCLCGILTDTGTFRFANTDRHTLSVAGALLDAGVDYDDLNDRLRWRHPSYFRRLADVLATVRFELDGALVTIHQTAAMRQRFHDGDDDSDDFVSVVRYAEGTLAAAYLREVDGGVKVSLRSRTPFSARRVCSALGGGGHEVAAGARLAGVPLEQARERLHAAAAEELERLHAAEAEGRERSTRR
jgi:bifunctional oligoribonuclease and PAP phosphatase NrnA